MSIGLGYQTVMLLTSDSIARKLFDIIAQNRSIQFARLLRKSDTAPEDAMQALKKLTDSKLISTSALEVTKAVDFDTYYVTANGLEAQRKTGGG